MEEQVVSWIKLVCLCFTGVVLVLKLALVLWWRPRKIQLHFSKQGIRGPPYRFFIGNVRELVAMMLRASSQPMPFSHNILPRVLSFYHHWKKIYGIIFFLINLSSFTMSHSLVISRLIQIPSYSVPKWDSETSLERLSSLHNALCSSSQFRLFLIRLLSLQSY